MFTVADWQINMADKLSQFTCTCLGLYKRVYALCKYELLLVGNFTTCSSTDYSRNLYAIT